MRSAASRTPRRRAGLATAAAILTAVVLGLGGAPALAQCLPEAPPPPPPDCGCLPPIDAPLPLPPPPVGSAPTFHVNAVTGAGTNTPSVSESAGSVKFKITMDGESCFADVSYQTVDGTAQAGQDYTSKTGHVSLDFNNPDATVTVAVTDDAMDEPDETFGLQLGGDGSGTGIATIVDDDVPPTISIGNATVDEGTGTGAAEQFPVTLSAPSGFPITVSYTTVDQSATAGTDFQPTTGTLTFAPGTTRQTISVPLVGDATGEPDETFGLDLSTPSNATIANAAATGMIVNDDGAIGSTGGGGGGGGGANAHNSPNQTTPPGLDVVPPIITLSAPIQQNGSVVWEVTCPATEQVCEGRVKITTEETSRKAKVAVMAKRRKTRVVKLGAARYRLKGGETKKVRVKINNNGRRLVRKKHKVAAKALFVTRDKSGNVSRKTQNVTLNELAFRHS
jgi:Calx-beta domain